MSASQVLFNDDILRIVIHHMHALRAKVNTAEFPDPAHEEQVIYRSSCYALARVCKSLQEPALDALWAFTYNIMHLLNILPTFYCEDPTAQKKVFMLGPIAPDDMARFQLYARRIKALQMINNDSQKSLHPSVQENLLRASGGRPLLPSLQDLRVNTPVIPADLLNLVTSSLRHVRLADWQSFAVRTTPTPEPNTSHDAAFFELLAREPVEIHTLVVERLILSSSAFTTLCKLRHLRSLRIVDATEDTSLYKGLLTSLPGMQWLRSLSLEIDCDMLSTLPSSSTFDLVSLDDLTLHGRASSLEAFFRKVKAPRLQTLHAMGGRVKERLASIHSCAEVIGSMFTSATPAVNLWIYFRHNKEEEAQVTMTDLVQPFLHISHLQSICIMVSFVPPLEDDGISAMAQAWPEVTRIVFDDGSMPQQGAPLAALATLARYCPKLGTLVLPLVYEPMHTLPDQGIVAQRELQYFQGGHAWPSDKQDQAQIEAVARYIHSLFPCISTEVSLAGSTGRKQWTLILEAYKAIQMENQVTV